MRWALHTIPLSAVNFECILSSIQSFLAKLGLQHYGHAASLWVFFAACGVTELFISFLDLYAARAILAADELAET